MNGLTSTQSQSAPRSGTALAALLAGAAAIASSALWVKISEAGPVSTAFWRVILALPLLCAWAAYDARHHPRAMTRTDQRLMIIAGFCFAGDLAVWHWSILLTSVANATLFANCAPIFVTLAAWLAFRRPPSVRFLVGLTAAIVGMFMLLHGDFRHSGYALLGDVLGIVTAVFYAGYQMTVSRARDTVSTGRLMAVTGIVSAIILLPIALGSGERFLPVTTTGWLLLVGLALTSQVAGQSLIAYALAHLPGTFASVALLVQAVIAAALAWLLLGETLTTFAIVGGVLVLIGIRIAHTPERTG
jgi:drug/metabolite transporter (DMT)-like permease